MRGSGFLAFLTLFSTVGGGFGQRVCQTPDCLMVDSTSSGRALTLFIFVPKQTERFYLEVFDGQDDSPVSEPTTFVLFDPAGEEVLKWKGGVSRGWQAQTVTTDGRWGVWRLSVTGPQPPKDQKGAVREIARNFFIVRTVGAVDLYLKPESVVLARGLRISQPRFGTSEVHQWFLQVPRFTFRVRINFLRQRPDESTQLTVQAPNRILFRSRWGGLGKGSLEFLEIRGSRLAGLWQLTISDVKGIYSFGCEQDLRFFCHPSPLMPEPVPVPIMTHSADDPQGLPARLEITSDQTAQENHIEFTDLWGRGVLYLLPSVRYRVTASRGFEYDRTTSEVAAQTSPVSVQLRRIIDRPTGWYCGDNHCHTVYSDGNDTPIQMARAGFAEGLDWVTITDHGVGPLIQQVLTAHLEALPGNLSGRFLIIPGEEFTTPLYHANIINGTVLDMPTTPLRTLVDRVLAIDSPERPVTLKLNHPRWSGTPKASELALELEKLPLIELWNSPEPETTQVWWELLNRGVRVLAETSTDSHNRKASPLGARRTYVFLGDKPLTAANVVRALRDGPSFLSRGALLLLTVNGRPPGATVSGNSAHVSIEMISARPVTTVRLIADGKVLQSFDLAEETRFKKQVTISLNFRWILAQALWKGDPVPLAMTNPIFVER